MNKNAEKWVAALKSGDYDQTQSVLKRTASDPDNANVGHCCLGVACEVYHKETGEGEWKVEILATIPYFVTDDSADTPQTKNDIVLPVAVREWLGLASTGGDYLDGYGDASSLTDLNDSGATFAEIADLIESEPDGLFA